MRTVGYLYCDPLWETQTVPLDWGQPVDQVYEDADAKRPQLQVLLKDAAQSPPAYVLVRRLEEFGSSLDAVTDCLTQLESLAVCVIALEQDYRSTAVGLSAEPQANLLILFNSIQQAQRSRQIREGHALNRMKGLPPPGRAPYGYRRGRDRYVIDRSVAPILRDFFEHFLLYGSIRGAVRHLAQKHSKQISVSTGHRWLTHPVYRGNLVFRNAEVQPNTHAPLLLHEEAAQVDRLLQRNRSLAPRAASAPRSLSGLVTCQQCQSIMTVSRVTARRRSQEYLYLRPVTCPQQPKCRALSYSMVLQQTIAQICQTLPPAVANLTQPPVERIRSELLAAIHQKQQAMVQLPELIAQQILDDKTGALRRYTLNAEIAQVEARLAQLPPVNLLETVQTVSLQQFWMDLSEAERRFYFREFLDGIEIIRQDASWSIYLRFRF
jgi:DNA invertase Pin-like site-specific DNA recombinase